MDDISSHGLMIAAGLILTCVVISLAIYLANSGRGVLLSFGQQMNETHSRIADSGITQYDGVIVQGSDVINCIRRYKDKIDISVFKNVSKSTAGTSAINTRYDASVDFVNLPSQAEDDFVYSPVTNSYNADGKMYINPNAEFEGRVAKNENGVVSEIVFRQKDFRLDAYDIPEGNTTIIVNNGSNSGTTDLDTALAGMNNALNAFTEKFDSFISLGTGGSDVNSALETLLYQLTNDDTGVLTLISKQIQNIGSIGGGSGNPDGDTDISTQLSNIQAELTTLMQAIQSGGLGVYNEHTADDVYDKCNNIINQLGGIENQISSFQSEMLGQFSALNNKLDNYYNSIMDKFGEVEDKLDKIDEAGKQRDQAIASNSAKLDNISAAIQQVIAAINSISVSCSCIQY